MLAHHERRQCHDGWHWIPVFHELWDRVCRYPDCPKRGHHAHEREVADLRARELLSLGWEAWCAAFAELRRQDPKRYLTMCAALRELREEAEEDLGKATDDRGRRVA